MYVLKINVTDTKLFSSWPSLFTFRHSSLLFPLPLSSSLSFPLSIFPLLKRHRTVNTAVTFTSILREASKMAVKTVDNAFHVYDANHHDPGYRDQPSARLTGKAAQTAVTVTTMTTAASPKPQQPSPDIIDIRKHAIESDLGHEIMSMLGTEKGPKKMPTMLLYDSKGLQIFEQVRKSRLLHQYT